MLTDLRHKSQSFVIYMLFGILIVVFISFGPGTQRCSGNGPQGSRFRVGWAAKVHGDEIDQQEVEAIVRRQMAFGGEADSPDELAQLRRMVLLQMVDTKVLEQRARGMGLAVGEDELNAYIMDKERNPDFPLFADHQGNFDYHQYVAQVQQRFGTDIAMYRKLKSQELLVRKYLDFLQSQVKVADPEVREAWERAERKWNLEYVAVQADDAAQVPEPTAEEASAYVQAHADAVQKYYDEHKHDYDRGKEVHVRRILVKVPEGANDQAKAEIKKKAEELRTEASKPGADFAALARAKSEDYYKDYDGDMGWQSKDNTNEHDFEVYSKLEQGQLSDVVESPIGFWFVKAEEVRPPMKKTLDEAKPEIGRILAKEESRKKAARTKAEALLAKARETGSLTAAVGGAAPAPASAAPEAPKNDDAAPRAADEGKHKGKHKKGKKAAETEKAPEAATAATPTPAPTAAPTYEVKETGQFSGDRPAWDRIPGIGESKELAKRLNDLTTEKPLLDEVIEVEDQFMVVRLKERVEPDASQFEQKKPEIQARLERMRQAQLFGNWEILLFGPARQRDLFLKFARPALLASLGTDKDPAIQINEEAFPDVKPAEKPADSRAALQ
jgi:parvulin-like peptidyl-prolyl isomerase